MPRTSSQTAFHALLYGGATVLLAFNLFFLVRAVAYQDFIPLALVLASILTAIGLLFIIYAEHKAREQEKREHRRLSRVANQLESPLHTLQDDLAYLTAQADKLPAGERLKLKRMETKTKILLENIRDVFLLLQSQEGPIAQDIRAYDVCALVKEAIERVKPLASAHNVEIAHKSHCQNAPVQVDRRLFLIAIVHLLENSILYTLTPGLVNIAVLKGRYKVRIVIQDRGIGIKQKDKKALWQPFARGHAANQYDPDGIGVGLSLSRMIIGEFDGILDWRHRQNSSGMQFEIKLPLLNKN